MEYDVFISYSHQDYMGDNKVLKSDSPIIKIREALDNENIKYWIDRDGIYSSVEFMQKVSEAIRCSKMMIFISSINSNSSEWTPGEVITALKEKKSIIPIRIDDTKYSDKIEILLNPLDHIDYFLNPEYAISQMILSVKYILNKIKEDDVNREFEIKRKEQLAKIDKDIQEKNDEKNDISKTIATSQSRLREIDSQLSKLYSEKDTLLGKITPGFIDGAVVMKVHPRAFLLVEEYGETQVYCLYDGINIFGSSMLAEEDYQQIVVSTDELSEKHFSINIQTKDNEIIYKLTLLNNNSISLNSIDNKITESVILRPNDKLLLGEIEFKITENLNKK